MQHMLHTGKRVVSAAVAAATIAVSVGLAGLIAPSQASAASAGDLIKGSLSTVYYYGYDGMRYTFPDEKTYMTWFSDFSDVTTISDSALADLELAGNVVYRPGSYFVKITSDPKVYAVSTSGAIRWIESEEVAIDLGGSNWAGVVRDVPDSFFVDYTVGSSLMTATAFDGMLYMDGGNYYMAWDGEKRMISSAGRSANNLQAGFFLDGAGIDDSALTAGDDITSVQTALVDPAQTETTIGGGAEGDVTLSSSSATPAGASLPKGANSVEVFSFDVAAGSEDATFDSVVLSMTGAGASTNISNVYLYEGETRLTEARSVNASTRQVTFSNIGLEVAAGDETTVTVRIEASSSAAAADTFGFKIADDSDVTASGDVAGSFPITGNTFTFTTASAGSITVTKSGTITDPTVGEQDAVIGMFKIATTNEAAAVENITLKIDNASDHSDFWLLDGEVALVEGENTSGDLVVFDLSASPFAITDGGSNVFSVTADIGGQSTDTIKVFVDNLADIVAIGGDYGFGMTVDINDATGYDGTTCTAGGASNKCSVSTIQGGDITITSNGPSAGDIQTNSQDVHLLDFTFVSVEEVTIKDFDVIVYADDAATLDGNAFDDAESGNDDDDEGLMNGGDDDTATTTGDEASIKDIKIINTDTGAVVMGPLELDSAVSGSMNDALQTIDFTDDWTIDAGETVNLAVVADIDDGVTTGTAFGATLDLSAAATGSWFEDSNGDAVAATAIVPSGDIIGYSQVARTASLVVSLSSTPGDVTSVDGSDDVLVAAWSFVAGTASDLHVSSIEVGVYADDDDGTFATTAGDISGLDVNDFIESCYLTDSSGDAIGTAAAPISSGASITINDANWDLLAGTSETVKVYCDFANPSDGSDINYFAFDLVDLSEDITVEDESNTDIDPTTDTPNSCDVACTDIVTLNASGSLAITAGASTPQADFLLTSSQDNHVASYRITATDEDFTIQTFTVTEEEATDDTGTAADYANNISLVTITYPLADGTTGESSVSMVGNEAKFTGLSMFVEVGDPSDVNVYVDVPLTARDAGGSATSNEEVRMGFSDGDGSGDENFRALGVGSGTALDEASSGIADLGDDAYATDGIATFTVRETKPTFSLSSSSPSGASVPGLIEVLRFNVSASSNEDVILEQLTFKVTSTDIGTSNWNDCDTNAAVTASIDDSELYFYNLTKSASTQLDTADTDWTKFTATGAQCVDGTAADVPVGYLTIDFPTVETIPAGSTYTYQLKIDTSNASASADDAIRVDIASEPSTTFLTTTGDNSPTATPAITDTTLAVDAPTDFFLGDIICLTDDNSACGATDERALVVSCTDAGDDLNCDSGSLTVIRGYLGSTRTATQVTLDEIDRIPGAMLWQDDGSVAAGTTTQTRWGGYMVDSLSIIGGTLVF